MKKIIALTALTLCMASCENTPKTKETTLQDESFSTEIKTPFDQSEKNVDLTITQKIRQLIMANPSISVAGKNINVVTEEGIVTLTGPVENDSEKVVIEKIVAAIPGVKKVDNQLVVKSAS